MPRDNEDETEKRIRRLESQVELHTQILAAQRGRRRDFSHAAKELFRKTALSFGGVCLPCGQTQIVDALGNKVDGACEYDHFHGRHLNDTADGWAICQQCNDDFQIGRKERYEFLSEFNTFQRRLREIKAKS
jgi:hypothetical protein